VVAAIRDSGADVLLVAMGVPMQDLWLRRNLKRSGATVGMGVGGLFDFYGGRIPRAPLWLREIGGEWAYRLWQEPRRMWHRYLVGNATFLWRVMRERMAGGAANGN
jgi:N-acetylglucosaminyldiphosphoundecaprenol N-acetyl-beta-D-mannosaminyltransferase